jgi:phage-related minor tail protein
MALPQEAELLYKIRVDASKAIKDMEAASGTLKNFQTQAANSTRSTGGLQRGVQNASYQLQDFIVQTSMGTDALRAFAQQAPQLLGGFGALGAAVGVIASLTPVVIQLFKNMANEAKSLEDATKGVTDATKLLKENIDLADRKSLDPLIESYKKADLETRKLILSTMELNIAIGKVAANDLQDSFLNSLDEGVKKLGFFNRLLLETKKYLADNKAAADAGSKNPFAAKAVGLNSQELLTEGFGISKEQLSTIQDAQKQLDAAKISASEFFGIVSKVYLETSKPTKDFQDWVQGLQKAAKAQKEYESQVKELTAAQERLRNGDTSTTKSIEDRQKAWEKASDKQIDSISKEFEALEKLREARVKEANQLKAMSDPMAAYNIALEKARVLLNDNVISTEEYTKAIFRAETTLANSNRLVNGFGDALSNAFTGAALAGKSFGEVMRSLATDIQAAIVKIMIIEPMIRSLKLAMVQSGYFGTSYNQTTPGFVGPPVPSAKGNIFDGPVGGNSNVIPFAKGGVLHSPRYFPMAGGKTGLAGEAGSEAIIPLKRGKDGKLGVSGEIGGGGTQVNVFNQTGGEVETSKRKDSSGMDVIDIIIKKAVADGIAQGQFDKTFAATYGLRRQGSR